MLKATLTTTGADLASRSKKPASVLEANARDGVLERECEAYIEVESRHQRRH
jgi:hypothetical protein